MKGKKKTKVTYKRTERYTKQSFRLRDDGVDRIVDRLDFFDRTTRIVHQGETEIAVDCPDFGHPGVGRQGTQALEGVASEVLRYGVPFNPGSLVSLRWGNQAVLLVTQDCQAECLAAELDNHRGGASICPQRACLLYSRTQSHWKH